MLGAIAGDVIGSVFEGRGHKSVEFDLFRGRSSFTDDTVCTVAVASWVLDGGDLAAHLREFGRRHPLRGYGIGFLAWLLVDGMGPYNSWGNGSAMRVSPVAWAYDDEERVLAEAERSAEVTHNHPEGIRGAQATALAVFRARRGADKDEIRRAVESRFGYDLGRSLDEIRPGFEFDESCQGTVPHAIRCVLESHDFESAIRLAISLGGDADTLACIAGSIAEAHYGGVPAAIADEVLGRLSDDLREVTERFRARYCGGPPGRAASARWPASTAAQTGDDDAAAAILALERAALDRWCAGDPSGFLEISAPDVVYFDPYLERRLDGLAALTEYYGSLRGKVFASRYEITGARVQRVGEAAVLTFNFASFGEGGGAHRWNCTEVYRRDPGGWRIIQTHWSFTQGKRG